MKDLFKVKKIKTMVEVREQLSSDCWRTNKVLREFIGVITPKYEISKSFSNRISASFLLISSNMGTLITTNGETIDFRFNESEISTTRITNKNVRDIMDKLIIEEKEKYKIAMETIKLQEKSKNLISSFSLKEEPIENYIGQLIKEQNLMNPIDFKEEVLTIINNKVNSDNSFKIKLKFDGFNLNKIIVEKEIKVGSWVKKGEYSFVTFEYDKSMHIYQDYENCEDYKKLIDFFFKNISKEEINQNKLTVQTEPYTSDKDSLFIRQTLLLDVEFQSTQINISKVISLINEMISIMK